MIEVIKHGQKKFKAICTNCGCEFTYELSDMKPLGGVDCPDCGEYVVHQIFGNNNGNLYYPPNCRGVEKMAVIGCVRNPQAHTAEECAKCDFKQGQCNAYRHAEALYNAGYRKTFTSDLTKA